MVAIHFKAKMLFCEGNFPCDKPTVSLQEPESDGPFTLAESSKCHVTFSWNVALPGVFLFHACAKAQMPPSQVSVHCQCLVLRFLDLSYSHLRYLWPIGIDILFILESIS